VKAEMQQILARGPNAGGSTDTLDPLQTYSEQVIEFDSAPSTLTVSPAQLQAMSVPEEESHEPTVTPRSTLITMVALVLVVLAGAAIVLWRARGRD